MEPFSIICKSCAAKLKVTKASAIGQVLACPKCGTMVKVAPPKGSSPPAATSESLTDFLAEVRAKEASSPSSDAPDQAGPMLGDFEDIDAILAKPDAPRTPKPTKKPRAAAPAPPKPPRKSRQSSSAQQQPSQQAPASKAMSAVPGPKNLKNKKRPEPIADQPSPKTAKQVSKTKPAPAVTGSEEEFTPVDGPVLPTDQWTSDETRKRKRMVLTMIGMLAFLVLSGTVVIAIALNADKGNPVVQKDNPDQGNAEDVENEGNGPLNADQEGVGQANQADNDQPKGALEQIENGNLLEDDNPNGEAFEEGPGGFEMKPPNISIDVKGDANDEIKNDLPELENASVGVGVKNPTEAMEETNGDTQDESASPFDSLKNEPTRIELDKTNPNKTSIDIELPKENSVAEPSNTDQFEDIGELSSLLEASGTSLLEIKDIATTLRDERPVGLPKYVIERPDPIRLDFERLAIEVGGLSYEQIPLSTVLRNITAISGIPITLDANSIHTAGKSTDPEVDRLIKDSSLETALNELIEFHGLNYQLHENGISVGVYHSPEFVEKSHGLSGIQQLDDPNRIVALIRMMIEPEIWVLADNPAEIALKGPAITATCPQAVHDQINVLISKLSAASRFKSNPDDEQAVAIIQTRTSRVRPILEQATGLKHTLQKDIGTFLTRLQRNTGLTVAVDWINITAAGWNPQTIVPGNVKEETVEEVLYELGRCMDLTTVAIDDSTVVFTSYEAAQQQIDIEVYPVEALIKAGFNEPRIARLIDEAIGRQVHLRKLEPSCECLVVAGPQSVQRQIEAALNRAMGKK